MARSCWIFLFTAFLGLLDSSNIYSQEISIHASESLRKNSITRQAINDFATLLEQACSCPVEFNREDAGLVIILPVDLPAFEMDPHHKSDDSNYPIFHYPDHGYTWNATTDTLKKRTMLHLAASSFPGVSNALYGLLQEKLGFAFYHPREMVVPDLSNKPHLGINAPWNWHAEPRFNKKGFHLHTQHPLELTEQLMMLDDESWPDVKEYIDWLARNQQNYFEFNLLEGIDRSTWPHLAKRMVDYLHSRGIIAGLDLSLHMIQQKSFMLYLSPPNSLRSKEQQIKKNVDMLFEADWDVWNVEFSTTEFSGGNVEQKKKLQAILNEELIRRNCKLMGRAHVVKEETMVGSAEDKDGLYIADTVANDTGLDAHRGIMSHTVMFYTASEEHAPVYGNENLQHMLSLLIESAKVRETWYYPESAYWITFDNSVPMLLLPYLNARLDDILSMDSLNVPGHLTFSSGWEWGYWLIDWSIARWSWEHTFNDEVHIPKSSEFIHDVVKDADFTQFFNDVLNLQQEFLKDKNMIRFMVAQTVTDEMPGPFDLQLHPRPEWKYSYMMNEATKEECAFLSQNILPELEKFHYDYSVLRSKYTWSKGNKIIDELTAALDITSMRSNHRYYTLKAIIQHRKAKLGLVDKEEAGKFLDVAEAIRQEALKIVSMQEMGYRYALPSIAGKRWDHTCYHFGYLYPVHDLHFWYREEMQVRKNKWGPLFMNIWNITRTVGITD